MKKLNKLMITLSLIGSLSVAGNTTTVEEVVEAPKKNVENEWLDKIMLTINPDIKTKGPIFAIDASEKAKKQYGSNIGTIMLQEAHKLALPYYKAEDYKGYYTFMVLALTVPYHEGLYVHFRSVDGDKSECKVEKNNGESLKSPKAKANFDKYLAGKLVPLCEEVEGQKRFKQIIAGGADGSDLGVMQMSMKWHGEGFLAKKQYNSVRATLRYGMKLLFKNYGKGFKKLYATYKDHTCLQNEEGELLSDNLIRGTWVRYNGGQTKDPCRFTLDKIGEVDNINDKGFLSSLSKTKALIDPKAPMGLNKLFGVELKPHPYIRAALSEIVSNYENGTNKRTNINSVSGLKVE